MIDHMTPGYPATTHSLSKKELEIELNSISKKELVIAIHHDIRTAQSALTQLAQVMQDLIDNIENSGQPEKK